jgi:hypothetical protein
MRALRCSGVIDALYVDQSADGGLPVGRAFSIG